MSVSYLYTYTVFAYKRNFTNTDLYSASWKASQTEPRPGCQGVRKGPRLKAGGHNQDARWLPGPFWSQPLGIAQFPRQVLLLDPDNEMRKNLVISSGVKIHGRKELVGFLAV